MVNMYVLSAGMVSDFLEQASPWRVIILDTTQVLVT